MIVPSAMYIESAADDLKHLSVSTVDAQQRELEQFGHEAAKELGASGLSQDFRLGYALGLQAMRTVNMLTPGKADL